ncbi:hypothetical protein EVAR_60260_1 [Eumeta japonica]|uniref:Uncharacterized protein n=1 Tax=Eumeta variegata TaxID=151549 RepID=A0A4C1YZP4_EUMVA|nr:hypothetical protein EVAR_60260_1 [Eumeta japonica]
MALTYFNSLSASAAAITKQIIECAERAGKELQTSGVMSGNDIVRYGLGRAGTRSPNRPWLRGFTVGRVKTTGGDFLWAKSGSQVEWLAVSRGQLEYRTSRRRKPLTAHDCWTPHTFSDVPLRIYLVVGW